MNINIEKMGAYKLFTIRTALTLLAEKNHSEKNIFGDFDTIAELEKVFTIAYQNAKEIE